MDNKMRYIYRVEDKEGFGCYNSGIEEIRKHMITNGHPTPKQDKDINRSPKKWEKCGFLTLSQVMAWFTTNDLKMLAYEGYYLKRIKVNLITAIGKTQVLFI